MYKCENCLGRKIDSNALKSLCPCDVCGETGKCVMVLSNQSPTFKKKMVTKIVKKIVSDPEYRKEHGVVENTEFEKIDNDLPVIEKNIQIPQNRTALGAGFMGVISKMEVDDSIFFPKITMTKASGKLSYAKKILKDFKFTARSMDDGVRFWRIK